MQTAGCKVPSCSSKLLKPVLPQFKNRSCRWGSSYGAELENSPAFQLPACSETSCNSFKDQVLCLFCWYCHFCINSDKFPLPLLHQFRAWTPVREQTPGQARLCQGVWKG